MNRRKFSSFKEQAIALRKKGRSYGEIRGILKTKIPKSTLSLWCVGVAFTEVQLNRIEERIKRGGEIGRATALALNRHRREIYFESLFKKSNRLREHIFSSKKTAKAILATLYLAEGSKGLNGRLMFGNSDPGIIALFMDLMHFVYEIDDRKFRCTVQCRADQNIPSLELFWARITKVPRKQFYRARIDARTIGKKTLKQNYKAVCRIDYFSAAVYNDLLVSGKVLLGEKFGPMV